jgi:hypothetical protein
MVKKYRIYGFYVRDFTVRLVTNCKSRFWLGPDHLRSVVHLGDVY